MGLGSAPLPPVGPDDHVRGSPRGDSRGPDGLLIAYMDLACPHCAGFWARLKGSGVGLCVRHFPVASKRPRAQALHLAAEAVAAQGEAGFWDFWDSLYADRGRVDDPHLWARVEDLGLDLDRFERDRRSAPVAERVREDFRSGIRAGVSGTPSIFRDGLMLSGDQLAELA